MDYPQPPTHTQMYKYTTYGVVNKNIHQKSTKSMEMSSCWLRDRECQKNYEYIGDLVQQIWKLLDEASLG